MIPTTTDKLARPAMLGTALTRFHSLKAAEYGHDLSGNGDKAQACANEADRLRASLKADLDAILAPHGLTVEQVQKAELVL